MKRRIRLCYLFRDILTQSTLVFKNDRKGVSLSNRQTDILAERSAIANEIYGIKI
jgi:hypothetical protein